MNKIKDLIQKEKQRQIEGIELIASENFVSDEVLKAMGSVLTNKYAEGYPNKRYYGGCEIVDQIEELAINRAKKLFNADYANVQPHSGSQANGAVMLAILSPGDKILGFDLAHGGHLTHGSPVNFSGKIYNPSFYRVDPKTEVIDMNNVENIAKKEKPKLIICGGSSYSREWDFKTFREIADKVGAFLLGDIAHIAGLVATNQCNDPMKHCHFITTTTHKTIRGPRGGMIMIGNDFENTLGIKSPKGRTKMMSELLNSAVFPGTQGGPLMHVIAAKAVAFEEDLQPNFKTYISQVKKNAKKIEEELLKKDYRIVSNKTENHLILLDLKNKNITGKVASNSLEKAGISVNKNMIPFDQQSPFITSGIRLGTPAITTRGLLEKDMPKIAEYIDRAILNHDSEEELLNIKNEIKNWMIKYPLYQASKS
ncbi:MAG: serine hydroxymethyltransferase [Bacteroidetes bacterium]|nr:serine hydroxymethyltransferase [Bacteroidota bacterium]